jgi:hypothetical protein
LKDEDWELLLEGAKHYSVELYDNICVYHDIASILRDIVYEGEPNVNKRDFSVEGIVLNNHIVDTVITGAKKLFSNTYSIAHEEISVLSPHNKVGVIDMNINMDLILDKKVTLPEKLTHALSFPCSTLNVYRVKVYDYNMHVWIVCSDDASYDGVRTIIDDGKARLVDLLSVSYMLSEKEWEKIIDNAGYYLYLAEVALNKFKKASVVLRVSG